MESNKSVINDFAPSWLKQSSLQKINNNNNGNTSSGAFPFASSSSSSSSSSSYSSTKNLKYNRENNIDNITNDGIDLRPQYLKRNTDSNILTNNRYDKIIGNNNLKDTVSQRNDQHHQNHLFNNNNQITNEYDSYQLRKYSLNGNNNISNNQRFNSRQQISSNTKFDGNQKNRDDDQYNQMIGGQKQHQLQIYGQRNKNNLSSSNFNNTNDDRRLIFNGQRLNQNSSMRGGGKTDTIVKNQTDDSNSFREEFPSLVSSKVVNTDIGNGNNVWDNVKNRVLNTSTKKLTLIPHRNNSLSASVGDVGGDIGGHHQDDSGYRLFSTAKKRVNNGIVSSSKDLTGTLSNLSLGHSKMLPVFAKSYEYTSSNQSMEILGKKPTKMRNNKSAASVGSSKTSDDINCSQQMNGKIDLNKASTATQENSASNNENCVDKSIPIHNSNVSSDNAEGRCILSSSIEAEERLLREMGWNKDNENDNFYEPLTEDEVREFRDLINSRNILQSNKRKFLFEGTKSFTPLFSYNEINNIENDDKDYDSSSSSDDDLDSDH